MYQPLILQCVKTMAHSTKCNTISNGKIRIFNRNIYSITPCILLWYCFTALLQALNMQARHNKLKCPEEIFFENKSNLLFYVWFNNIQFCCFIPLKYWCIYTCSVHITPGGSAKLSCRFSWRLTERKLIQTETNLGRMSCICYIRRLNFFSHCLNFRSVNRHLN